MKQFMVLAAILPLLLIFTLQSVSDQMNFARINYIDQAVYSAKEKAKQEGCFTEKIISGLFEDISKIGIPEDRITIDAYTDETKPIERLNPENVESGKFIDYAVSVDLSGFSRINGIFASDGKKQRYIDTVKAKAVSEYLGSEQEE